jgi:CBS domain containing-hemolysin-like protein
MILESILPLAETAGELNREWPTIGEALLYLLGIVFFLLLNAFFVASEFAIVKVRLSQIETDGQTKPRRAKVARHVVERLDGYLSANQLGITIASLALGFLGEPFVEKMVSPVLLQIPGFPEPAIHPVSFGLAIASFTFLHVVIGELLPKSIAIRKALPTTLIVARPLHWFYVLFRWVIALLNGTANWLLKHVFRIDPIDGAEHAHSAEEIALLVAESEKSQEVTETEREILINALELNDVWVRDVMTPRSEVVVLDLNDPLEKSLEIARNTKHTRFPLVKDHLDNAVGLIHIKDLIHLIGDEDPDLMRIKRELKVVPDTMALDTLLQFFLKEHAHLALAVDEFGHPAGVVFLDNVIEELVGDIQDEFDNEASGFTPVNDDEFVVEGALTLNELSDHVPELVLESGEVTTVGGYVTQKIGRFPEVGDVIEVLGYEAKVTSASERRVGQLHFRRLVQEEESGELAAASRDDA